MRFVATLLAAALALAPVQAFAQATQSFNTTALPTSFTASTSTGSSPVPFPSPGPTAVIINNSTTVPVYLNMGSNTVSATTSDFLLGPGCIAAYNIAGKPYIAAITATGTALLQIQTGTGLPTLPSNACYIPVSFTGSYTTNLTQVNTNPVNTGVGASGSGTQRVAVASDSSLSITGAIPAGTNLIGKVGIDQTTPGTTNGVVVNSTAVYLGITPTDHTLTSATGASQTLMNANASRHSLNVVNTGNANCGINPTGGTAAIAGAGTLTLYPGGSYSPRVPTLSAVTAICTSGQPLYADDN